MNRGLEAFLTLTLLLLRDARNVQDLASHLPMWANLWQELW